MKKDFKMALQDAFEPPAPTQKKEFLKTIPQPEIGTPSFMLSQAGYIPKYVWGISILAFGIALVGAGFLKKDVLWIISALLPFAAVSLVTEHIRSNVYGMSELEMAARFSLKSVILARMGVIGVLHFVLLVFLIPVSAVHNGASVLQTGLYLLVPYLLTITIGLWAIRKMHGMESMYVCMGIGVGVSGVNMFVQNIFPAVYGVKYTLGWGIMLAILLILAVRGLKKNMKQTEEFLWNLS